jgi:ABC-type multidrug transport system fused ATPase/permease subunit
MTVYLSNPFASNLLSLWTHINNTRRRQLWLLLLLMLFSSVIELIGIGATIPFLSVLTAPERLFEQPSIKPILQALSITSPRELLLPMTIVFVAAALISGGARLLLLWAITRIASAIGTDFCVDAYRRSLYQPYSVHLGRNSSIVVAGVHGKTAEVVGLIVVPILVIINACLLFLMIISGLLFVEAKTAFLAFAGFSAMYLVVIFFSKGELRRNGNIINLQSNQIQKALQEGLGGIRDVLIDGTQEFYSAIYKNSVQIMRRAQANLQIISGSPRFIIEALGMALIAVLAFSLASRPEGIYTALPLIGVIVLSAQRLLPLLQQCYGGWAQLRSSRATLADVLELLDQPMPKIIDTGRKEQIAFSRSITLNNLEFQYQPGVANILKSISFSIPKGARIGVIGTTGSGKSTLLDLLMGLLKPTGGAILIDGQELNEHSCRAWQAHIAHVPQTIFLADITIAENIAFGVPLNLIDHARVRDAAAKAQIATFIESMPEGYGTLVGERGVRMSGGQRQRIGIARALYKDADVIVFDEATSALDTPTEEAVMSIINQLSSDLTILIVAHRLTTLKGCTEILELDDGAVKRIGTYSEIIN